MSQTTNLQRLTAFSEDPEGGNPAGVWIGDAFPDPASMQRIAAEVGFSETAFVTPRSGTARKVRYFSPLAEVPFCGHATIAAGVALGHADGEGVYELETAAGRVPVRVEQDDERMVATLTSVTPRHTTPDDSLVSQALDALNWERHELTPTIPPALAYAGAWHLVLATRNQTRLDDLQYDFEVLKDLMLRHDITTLQLIWQEGPTRIHSRNPFPVGGIVEDAATGAAAAALGGYLRDAGLVTAPTEIAVSQGVKMGRPSELLVSIPVAGGIDVTGTAVVLPDQTR